MKIKIACFLFIVFFLLSCKEARLSTGDIDYIKQKYSVEAINYFYETAFHRDFVGFNENLIKWNQQDIKLFMEGELWEQDSVFVESALKQINELELPPKLRLTKDKSQANQILYFGNYDYLAEKIIWQHSDKGLFVGGGTSNMSNKYKKDGVTVVANAAGRYTRHKTDSLQIRQSVILEEIVQSLGIIGDAWSYSNSIFYEGYGDVLFLSEIDKEVLNLLYEKCIPPFYSRSYFEDDFQDVLYNINASEKIVGYVLEQDIPFEYLQYIKDNSFRDSILIKFPRDVFVSLSGDITDSDTDFVKNLIHTLSSEHLQLQYTPAGSKRKYSAAMIKISYKKKTGTTDSIDSEMLIEWHTMMFPYRVDGELSMVSDEFDRDRTINNAFLKVLGFDRQGNAVLSIADEDSLQQEIVSLLYQPIFYSGMHEKQLDEAMEIVSAARNLK